MGLRKQRLHQGLRWCVDPRHSLPGSEWLEHRHNRGLFIKARLLEGVMAGQFTILKVHPATGKRFVLHQRVPEQISDWLCKICTLELKSADRAQGYVIVKESQETSAKVEIMPAPRAMRAKAS